MHFKLIHTNAATGDKTFTVYIFNNYNGFLDLKIHVAYHIINKKPNLNRNTSLFLTT